MVSKIQIKPSKNAENEAILSGHRGLVFKKGRNEGQMRTFFRHILWTRIRKLPKILPVISKFREKYYFCEPTLLNLAVVAQFAVNRKTGCDRRAKLLWPQYASAAWNGIKNPFFSRR